VPASPSDVKFEPVQISEYLTQWLPNEHTDVLFTLRNGVCSEFLLRFCNIVKLLRVGDNDLTLQLNAHHCWLETSSIFFNTLCIFKYLKLFDILQHSSSLCLYPFLALFFNLQLVPKEVPNEDNIMSFEMQIFIIPKILQIMSFLQYLS